MCLSFKAFVTIVMYESLSSSQMKWTCQKQSMVSSRHHRPIVLATFAIAYSVKTWPSSGSLETILHCDRHGFIRDIKSTANSHRRWFHRVWLQLNAGIILSTQNTTRCFIFRDTIPATIPAVACIHVTRAYSNTCSQWSESTFYLWEELQLCVILNQGGDNRIHILPIILECAGGQGWFDFRRIVYSRPEFSISKWLERTNIAAWPLAYLSCSMDSLKMRIFWRLQFSIATGVLYFNQRTSSADAPLQGIQVMVLLASKILI